MWYPPHSPPTVLVIQVLRRLKGRAPRYALSLLCFTEHLGSGRSRGLVPLPQPGPLPSDDIQEPPEHQGFHPTRLGADGAAVPRYLRQLSASSRWRGLARRMPAAARSASVPRGGVDYSPGARASATEESAVKTLSSCLGLACLWAGHSTLATCFAVLIIMRGRLTLHLSDRQHLGAFIWAPVWRPFSAIVALRCAAVFGIVVTLSWLVHVWPVRARMTAPMELRLRDPQARPAS